jgi:hypothetical protein
MLTLPLGGGGGGGGGVGCELPPPPPLLPPQAASPHITTIINKFRLLLPISLPGARSDKK